MTPAPSTRRWTACPARSGWPIRSTATKSRRPTPRCSPPGICWPPTMTRWSIPSSKRRWCSSTRCRTRTGGRASCTTSRPPRGWNPRPAGWPPSTTSHGPRGASTTIFSTSTATGFRSPSPRPKATSPRCWTGIRWRSSTPTKWVRIQPSSSPRKPSRTTRCWPTPSATTSNCSARTTRAGSTATASSTSPATYSTPSTPATARAGLRITAVSR